MIEKEQLDIVGVATYAPQHPEITIACAQKGVRAIYCEKPMTPAKLAEAEQMEGERPATRRGSILAINHNRRFNPNYRRLRDHDRRPEKLGDLTSANLRWGNGRLEQCRHAYDRRPLHGDGPEGTRCCLRHPRSARASPTAAGRPSRIRALSVGCDDGGRR